MSIVDLRSRKVTLTLGTLDRSNYFDDLILNDGYLDENGVITTTGTLTLTEFPGSQSLDDWLGQDWLRIGTPVTIDLTQGTTTTRHPRGKLYIQSAQYNEETRESSIEVACILAARRFQAPTDETKLSIDYTNGTTAKEVVDQLLALAGIPGTPNWGTLAGDEVLFYSQPDTGQSYIDAAGKILASMGMFCWQDGQGGIRVDRAIPDTLLATLPAHRLGDAERVTVGPPPATTAKVTGAWNTTTPNGETSGQVVRSYGELSDIVPGGNAVGTAVTSQLVLNDTTNFENSRIINSRNEDRLGYLVYRGLPGMPVSTLVESERTTEIKQYSIAEDAKLLYTTKTTVQPLYVVAQAYCDWAIQEKKPVMVSTSLTAIRETTSYAYNDDEELIEQVRIVREPTVKVLGEFSAIDWERFAQIYTIGSDSITERETTRWTKIGSGWRKITIKEVPPVRDSNGQAGLIARVAAAETLEEFEQANEIRDIYSAAKSPSVSTITIEDSTTGQSNPPAAERFPSKNSQGDQSVEVDVPFDGFATDWVDREKEYTVPVMGDWVEGEVRPLTPEGLAYQYGEIWHQLAIDRHKSLKIETPLLAEYENYRPYATIEIENASGPNYLVALNGTSWGLNETQCLVSSDCAFLGSLVNGQLIPLYVSALQARSGVGVRMTISIEVPEIIALTADASSAIGMVISIEDLGLRLAMGTGTGSIVNITVAEEINLSLGNEIGMIVRANAGGLDLISDTAADDAPVQLPDIGFDFPMYGAVHRTDIYASPNLYLTFGFSAGDYSGFSPTSPGKSLQLGASDRSIRALYGGAYNGGYKIRYEGYNTNSTGPAANIFYELVLYPDGAIEVATNYSTLIPTYDILITDGGGTNFDEYSGATGDGTYTLYPIGATDYAIVSGSYNPSMIRLAMGSGTGAIANITEQLQLIMGSSTGAIVSITEPLHADVLSLKSRIEAAGGTIATATLNALNTFVLGCEADGLRGVTPIAREVWIPLCDTGSPAAAVRQKLWWINNSALSSVGTEASYTLTGGATGSGSGGYLMGVTPTLHLSGVDGHFAVYNRTTGVSAGGHGSVVLSGSFPAIGMYERFTNGLNFFYWSDNGLLQTSLSDPTGFLLGVFNLTDGNSANWRQLLYRNGSQVGTRTPTSAGTQPNIDTAIFGVWTGSAIADATTRQIGGYSIGRAMNATQAANYYSRWQALMTAIGRNV